MYQQDSFFTLTIPGQFGLAIVSLLLAGGTLWLHRWLGRRLLLPMRIGAAIILIWLFAWLSPQVYYGYYLLIFEGLPLQFILQAPPGPGDVVRLMFLQGPSTLSAHSLGLLGWGLLISAFLPSPQRSELTEV